MHALALYYVFQMDDSWHVMTYSTSGGYVDNVVKIVIVFEEFPSREISVKDLAVHICMSTGMYVKCIKCMRNTRNQYASPPRQCNTGRARAEAIITQSCVVEGFVTQRPKTFIRFSFFF